MNSFFIQTFLTDIFPGWTSYLYSVISLSRGSSWLRDWTQVSCIAGRLFTVWAISEAT